jgi:hypothetical protein
MELQERITDAVVAELRVKSGTAHHFADLAPGQARLVARTLPPEPPTAAMRLGTHVHLAVLEPSEWQRRLGTRAPGKPYRPADANGKAKVGSAERSAYESWKADCDEWESEMERWRLDHDGDGSQRRECAHAGVVGPSPSARDWQRPSFPARALRAAELHQGAADSRRYFARG